MLNGDIIYNLEQDIIDLQTYLLTTENKKIGLVLFENISKAVSDKLKDFNNIIPIKAEISTNFISQIKNTDEIVLIAEINKTDSKLYKQIKEMIKNMNKNIAKEVLTRSK